MDKFRFRTEDRSI